MTLKQTENKYLLLSTNFKKKSELAFLPYTGKHLLLYSQIFYSEANKKKKGFFEKRC